MAKKSSNAHEVIQVAVDDGYAQVKACMCLPGAEEIAETIVPTFVAPHDDGMMALGLGGEDKTDGWYETENQRFMCGSNVNGEEVRFDNYHTSAWNRVAIHHVLHTLGLAGKKVHVTVGLPIGDYFIKGKVNASLLEKKTKSLMVPVQPLDDTEPVEIVGVTINPQGISAYIDYTFGADGRILQKPEGQIAIVDIGGRTLDVAVINQQMHIDFARSGTEDVGVLNLRESLAEKICDDINAKRLPLPAAEIALRTGSVRLHGKPRDYQEVRQALVESVGKRLIFSIDKIIGENADIETILFVGGGAVVFEHLATHYQQGTSVKNPELANARGMLKRAMASAKAA